MALFICLSILINLFTLLFVSGFNYIDNVKVIIEPSISSLNLILLRIDETLNLTCSISSDLPDIHLEWNFPGKTTNSQNKIDIIQGANWLNMVIKNVQEKDSGEYRCIASSNTNPELMREKIVRVTVKPPKGQCADMFQCQNGRCIHKRFTCDGKKDCSSGEDEAELICGADPCKDKRLCGDGRCIPSSWCCDPAFFNCTIRLACCPQLRDVPENIGYNDVTLFQTTVYTVIGCAMAFMFIVTIFIVAVCRSHMRQSLMPPITTPFVSQSAGRPSDPFSGLSPYDWDLLLHRPNDGISVNPLLVTYNINNGVQFVARPVDPPPYCEVVATPPREGPPPPYMSVENLTPRGDADPQEPSEGDEAKESDALLTPYISVISSSRIDESTNLSDNATASGHVQNVPVDSSTST